MLRRSANSSCAWWSSPRTTNGLLLAIYIYTKTRGWDRQRRSYYLLHDTPKQRNLHQLAVSALDAGDTRGGIHRGDMVDLFKTSCWTALGHIYTKKRRSDRRRRSYYLLRSTLNHDIAQWLAVSAMDAGNTRGVTHRGDMVQLFETNAMWMSILLI